MRGYAVVNRRTTPLALPSHRFPFNFLGCENEAEFGRGVKFITDDLKLECQGQDVCTSKPRVAGPSFMGV